jgi:hypothetical protein
VPHNYLNWKSEIQPTIGLKSLVNYETSGKACSKKHADPQWQAISTRSTALQDEIDNQRDDEQNGNLNGGAFHQRARTTICRTTPALTVISISSVHADLS